MPNEPIQGGPYPLLSDAANVPNDIKRVVDWAAPKVNMTFNSAGERDAAVPSPVAGMECFVGAGTSAVKHVYDGSAWVPISMGAVMGKRSGADAISVDAGQLVEYDPGPVQYAYGGVVADGGGFLVPVDGTYVLSAGMRMDSSESPEFQLRLRGAGDIVANQSVSNTRYINVSALVVLQAGDKVRIDLYNNGSSRMTGSPGFGGPYLAVALISPMAGI